MSWLINLIYACLLVLFSPLLVYKAVKQGKYRRGWWPKLVGSDPLPQRLPDDVIVWIHAVSVGEVLLLRPLLQHLDKRGEIRVVLSTSTDTGLAMAREKYPKVTSFYAPLDFSWAVRRTLNAVAPDLLILTELELWPNLLKCAKACNVPVMVVNARVSEGSFRGYRWLNGLLRPALAAVRWWGAQDKVYAQRIRALIGESSSAQVTVTGSMKFEGALTERDNPKTNQLRALFGLSDGEIVFIAGSTHDPEEELALDAFMALRQRYPRLRLILAPRHPERAGGVIALARARLDDVIRRSEITRPLAHAPQILVVDTLGELNAIWGLADFAFVGGSFASNRGGQSMIEPAALGVAVCFGPNIWNFHDTVAKLKAASAAILLQQPAELRSVITAWLEHPEQAKELGRRARDLVLAQQGAVDATCRAVERLLPLAPLASTRVTVAKVA